MTDGQAEDDDYEAQYRIELEARNERSLLAVQTADETLRVAAGLASCGVSIVRFIRGETLTMSFEDLEEAALREIQDASNPHAGRTAESPEQDHFVEGELDAPKSCWWT